MRALPLLLLLVLVACTPRVTVKTPHADLSAQFATAMDREARDALAIDGYLTTIETALAQPDDPSALTAVLASLDALIWRKNEAFPKTIEQAGAFRSRDNLQRVSSRLRLAWAKSAEGSPGGAPTAMRAFIADALHHLALRVGAEEAAAKWRRRTGCVPFVSVVGPLRWPALEGLAQPTLVPSSGALPAEFPGVPPFSSSLKTQREEADACIYEMASTGVLHGERAAIVDIAVPDSEPIWIALTADEAFRAELAGGSLTERSFSASGGATLRLVRARVQPGWARLVVRVARRGPGRLKVAVWSNRNGEMLATRPPRAGDLADARLVEATSFDPRAVDSGLVLKAAALLAAGDDRLAMQTLEPPVAPEPGASPVAVDLLRMRALEVARHVPEAPRLVRILAAAERVSCPRCWEAQIALAYVERQRKGFRTGGFDGLAVLRDDAEPQVMELAYGAIEASRLGLLDLARGAFDDLSARAPHSPLVADVDGELHRRIGPAAIAAACEGGRTRASLSCLSAHSKHGDLGAVYSELRRLRELRGSNVAFRDVELRELLKHGQFDRALKLYDALPPAERSVASLPTFADERMARDMTSARDAPFGFEPGARLHGVVPDPAPELERRGAELVAADRREPFLPGAATAILRRHERYRLGGDGVLYYVLYDLRRISGTADVARGALVSEPRVMGRATKRTLRRRIHKQDGTLVDPDPSARGRQRQTDLTSLQAGDYVETIIEGWAVPEHHGQLVVDTPDLLPQRTSVREATVELTAPKNLPHWRVWSHPKLPQTASQGDTLTWRLDNEAPRQIETHGTPLEARVAVSFGTDHYGRIGRSLAGQFRQMDDDDSFIDRWAAEAVGDASDDATKIARIVARVGKDVMRPDRDALSDTVASLGGGAQRETARWIIARGSGSRSWVIHRALRSLGIASEIAVAESRPFSASPDFPPRPGRFEHPLVRVGDVWIDADVDGPPLPPGSVSPELRGRFALRTNGELMPVEGDIGSKPDEIDIRLTLDSDGKARGTFVAILHGRTAQTLAEALEVRVGEQKTALLREVVLGWLPRADISAVTLSSEAGSWRIAVRAELELPLLIAGRDKTWRLPGMYPAHAVGTLMARYATQAQRSTALAIDDPLLYHVRRQVELAPTMTVSSSAPSFELNDPRLSASRTVQTARTIVEDFKLNLAPGTISAEDYDDFVALLRRTDERFLHGTTLRDTESPAVGLEESAE